jgi:sulfatase modifying factor 1
MIHLPSGRFTMGHSGPIETASGPSRYAEEEPEHEVAVNGFWIDKTEVTNAQFAAFVKATNYVTFAETEAKPDDLPAEAREQLPPGKITNGGIVFRTNPKSTGRNLDWWSWDPAANWQHPAGAGSDIKGKDNHPVVCVTFDDAAAYAKWIGKRLPTEAEWEYAARGILEKRLFVWGDELKPNGQWMANIWQGEFPSHNTAEDKFEGTAPVASFPPNTFGLYDMAGNAWELCSDYYDAAYFNVSPSDNPKGPEVWVNPDTGEKGEGTPFHVIKGGSFLCHASYCMRYRPAARQSQASDSPTNHIGFRCVKD